MPQSEGSVVRKQRQKASRPALGPSPVSPSPIAPNAAASVPVAQPPPLDAFAAITTDVVPYLEALERVRRHKVIAYYLDEGAALADDQVYHLYEHLRRVGRQERLVPCQG
jgi:hypothetical protein